jgi:hypothetical protein
MGKARNAYRMLVGKPEGKRDCSTRDLVVKVFIASSKKSIVQGGERRALKIVAELGYFFTDCALGPGGHFKFSSCMMRRDGRSIAPR